MAIKILVVDDEYSFCKLMKAYLENEGFQVVFTTNGDQALDMIRHEKPDVVTLDVRMPGLNGQEVMRRAKEMDPDIRVLILSAADLPEIEEDLMEAGAKAFFHKPVEMDRLIEAIKKHSR